MIKKGLAVAVILLFIGVAFTSSINSSVVEDELVEFEVELCGFGQKEKIYLTRQESDEVSQLFDNLETDLSQVSTRSEAEDIIHRAVFKLDSYGLLGSFSVHDFMKFIETGGLENNNLNPLFERILGKNDLLDDNSNYMCLTVGDTDNTIFVTPVVNILNRITGVLGFFYNKTNNFFNDILDSLYNSGRLSLWLFISFFLYEPIVFFSQLNAVFFAYIFVFYLFFLDTYVPVSAMSNICYDNLGDISNGYVFTAGLNGVKQWNGSIKGEIPAKSFFPPLPFNEYGVLGFNGIKISKEYGVNFDSYYIGFSAFVKIKEI